MSNIISTARPYLEALSFTATIILVVGLIFARFQLTAFLSDARTRNERLSKEKAIEATTRYLSEYIRLANIEYDRNKEYDWKKFGKNAGDFSSGSIPKPARETVIKYFKDPDNDLSALNELELIASYFVTRVADEQTGFRIIGRSYCSTVRSNYIIISMLRGDNTAQPYWYNIVALYKIWAPRLTRQEIESTSNELSRTLAQLPADRPNAPLGC